ncbi:MULTISPECIES: hypothetical protein [Vibrio]|uniref:hypothetical protein n=1 Tax=Vibrio TaxID=662 RepID=UPI000C85827D|nr:hypothetical protein [Vibrio splendidus]PMO16450.1 hypothetical protein BCT15_24195 [Vibrio splendidus]
MVKPVKQARAFQVDSKPTDTSPKSKKKLPAVREDQKKAAQVRRRIENILEQQQDEKEWML